ncbi:MULTISPECIES: bifunctional acetate--CoA ligase family protein/GNAT family N-acetyltransferase [unclassified Vibrio]|uniref:Bifunctional acetate--CoA ligase family protein/GNAT family N-acetyltransferase n=1 Tax=Vibrio sp. HB236076 TaxID=3232307 RepID=A0AB39HHR1_9VIBR|nr:bifunctional acetate--CoA ligase family protein/GNAT family N-acetyltransferase [Vibrio sp. HB161653]MDP5252984.1 bifunctional acetate--CoA ligase family protein/GNAT family N-acetyltransferase [Vibrio sp. HB161653]
MTRLQTLFNPNSIAVIGASNRPHRAGHVVIRNLLAGEFSGVVYPVTPNYKAVAGIHAYPDIQSLPRTIDIAILCTASHRHHHFIEQLSTTGCKFIIVIDQGQEKPNTTKRAIDLAKKNGMRVIGPNSLGIILPWQGVNLSFSASRAKTGNIAFLSQSASIITTVLDWAEERQIGFSAVMSLGESQDIHFCDLLDHFALDAKTHAIVLYVKSIDQARTFLSAARAASRTKRILVLKPGRYRTDPADIIYDSAIQRSGMLRVNNTHEMFAAVETLTHAVPLRGERLAIITNGGGTAAMAVDTLYQRGGKLATLTTETEQQLAQVLPPTWQPRNPVDILGDADQARYLTCLEILLNSRDVDAILIIHSPSAIAPATLTAEAIIAQLAQHPKTQQFNILTNWTGEKSAHLARQKLMAAGFPTYRTPESAIAAYMHLVEYRRNQRQLRETPSTAEPLYQANIEQAKQWIATTFEQASLSCSASACSTHEQPLVQLETEDAAPFFACFNMQVAKTWQVSSVDEAIEQAQKIDFPVALKLRSKDIVHKSEIQGVLLNLTDAKELNNKARDLLTRVTEQYPTANIEGFTIQKMAQLAGSDEVRIKVMTDAVFGPVIFLGQGGREWVMERDAVVLIPPLNSTLARYAILQALKENKLRLNHLDSNAIFTHLVTFLVQLSQMIIDIPELKSLDIHPLLLSESQRLILDTDLTLQACHHNDSARLAIRPFPAELVETEVLKDGTPILLRPILPEDEPLHAQFIAKTSKEDLYRRFFSDIGEITHDTLANFTQIDYDREMAFIALRFIDQKPEVIGVTRALIDNDTNSAEFAILIRSDIKGTGLGKKLLKKLINYGQEKQLRQLHAMTMPDNKAMIALAKRLGFSTRIDFEEGCCHLRLNLSPKT